MSEKDNKFQFWAGMIFVFAACICSLILLTGVLPK